MTEAEILKGILPGVCVRYCTPYMYYYDINGILQRKLCNPVQRRTFDGINNTTLKKTLYLLEVGSNKDDLVKMYARVKESRKRIRKELPNGIERDVTRVSNVSVYYERNSFVSAMINVFLRSEVSTAKWVKDHRKEIDHYVVKEINSCMELNHLGINSHNVKIQSILMNEKSGTVSYTVVPMEVSALEKSI